tara:strand:+ start:43 stop:531 length:489 start_codon:yes stop_codon:yes gene_type:complete
LSWLLKKINKQEIIVKLRIIGVNAIAANLPRVFRYDPASEVKQMKKTKGKVSRDRSTVRINLSGSSLKPGAISFTMKGIKISAKINKIKRKINNEEKIKEKNSSDLFFPNLLLIPEITGMNAEFIAPSPKSLLKRLGSLKEMKNASDTKPAPIIFAIKRSLK